MSLAALPAELIDLIVRYLPISSLKSARLVSSQLEPVASRTLFYSIGLGFDAAGISRLDALASSRYACHVRQMVLTFTISYEIEDPERFANDMEAWDAEALKCRRADVAHLLPSLRSSISILKGVRALQFELEGPDLVPTEVDEFELVRTLRNIYVGIVVDLFDCLQDHDVRELWLALSFCKDLDHFWEEADLKGATRFWTGLINRLDTFDLIDEKGDRNILELEIDDPVSECGVARILSNLQNVRDLRLFTLAHRALPMALELQPLRLASLVIRGCRISAPKLAILLQSSRESLRYLELGMLHLIAGFWGDIFPDIGQCEGLRGILLYELEYSHRPGHVTSPFYDLDEYPVDPVDPVDLFLASLRLQDWTRLRDLCTLILHKLSPAAQTPIDSWSIDSWLSTEKTKAIVAYYPSYKDSVGSEQWLSYRQADEARSQGRPGEVAVSPPLKPF